MAFTAKTRSGAMQRHADEADIPAIVESLIRELETEPFEQSDDYDRVTIGHSGNPTAGRPRCCSGSREVAEAEPRAATAGLPYPIRAALLYLPRSMARMVSAAVVLAVVVIVQAPWGRWLR
jgi:hypothetical protein